jgi:Na+/melibiose symporter-like transporter
VTHRIKLPVILAYAFGQIAEAVKSTGFNIFLLFYYNQVLHVSATATSVVLAIALIFDAVTDPVAGSLSDKLQSRWGRRHPFILFAAIPLAISFYLLFNPPADLSELGYVIWLGVFAVLVRGSMTFYHIPHLALGAELARDYNQRSTLYAYNTFFQFMGGAMFLPLSYRIFFPTTEEFNPALLNQAAYSPWALFAGGLMIFAIVVCVAGTWREIPRLRDLAVPAREKFGVKRLLIELWEVFGNPSFKVCFFGSVLTMFMLAVEGVFNPFMGFHFWGMTTEQLTYLPLGQLLGLVLSVMLVPVMTRRFDKKPTLIACGLLTVININTPIVLMLMDVSWFPGQGTTALLIILVVSAGITTLLAPIVFATVNSMFADIADEHELEIGERREGVIFSARAFSAKAAASLGLVFGGVLIDFIRFPRGAATSVFVIVGILLYLGYRIDRVRHAEIISELAAREQSSR